jgi:hypothetical protein
MIHVNISDALEKFRYVLFTGEYPEELTSRTQEEYIEIYEQQMERDPATEAKLIAEFGEPLLPTFRKQMEQLARMEQLISGTDAKTSFSDEEILNEIYDDVANIETEEEWQNYKKTVLSAL